MTKECIKYCNESMIVAQKYFPSVKLFPTACITINADDKLHEGHLLKCIPGKYTGDGTGTIGVVTHKWDFVSYDLNLLQIHHDTTLYLVALQCGGVMEDPDYSYDDFQIVVADNPTQARKIYNNANNCSYYWGTTICSIDKFTFEPVEMFKSDIGNIKIHKSGHVGVTITNEKGQSYNYYVYDNTDAQGDHLFIVGKKSNPWAKEDPMMYEYFQIIGASDGLEARRIYSELNNVGIGWVYLFAQLN